VGNKSVAKVISGWGNASTFEFLRAEGSAALVSGQGPALGGVQSGTPALAWPTTEGVFVQILDLLGNNDADPLFSRVRVSDSVGATNVQVVDALAAFGVGWQDGSAFHIRGVAQEFGAIGTEVIIPDVRSATISGYSFLTDVADPLDPAVIIEVPGVAVTWVSGPDEYGPIMLQRYQLAMDALGHPAGLVEAGIDGQAEAGALRTVDDQAALDLVFGVGGLNDDAIEVAPAGRDAKVASLHTGDTLVTWITADGQIHGQLFPPNGAVVPSDANNDLGQIEYDAINAQLESLGAIAPDVGAQKFGVQVAELGPGDFAVVWVVDDGAGNLGLQGYLFAVPPDTAAGGLLDPGWTRYDIDAFYPAGFDGQFSLTGFGEDNSDLAITYTADDADGSGVFARVIDASGIDGTPDALVVVGDVQVNTSSAGDQSLVATTGLISDRFMVSWVDGSGTVQSRIMDTREPGTYFTGDSIGDRNGDDVLNAGDRVRARPDVFVGTTGDDIIIGDLVNPGIAGVLFSDPLGADDQLFGGLGADVIFGGGGFDIIDGGLDLDTEGRGPDPVVGLDSESYVDRALFRANLENVNIFINGDGSYTVVDARFDDGDGIIDETDGGLLNIDGMDLVSNVEVLQFLEGDDAYIRDASYAPSQAAAQALLGLVPSTHKIVNTADLYQIASEDERLTGNVDLNGDPDTDPSGSETVLTPVGWALDDAAVALSGFTVSGDSLVTEGSTVIAAAIEGFVTAWEQPSTLVGATGVAVRMKVYDALGASKPVGAGPGDVIVVAEDALAGSVAIAGTGAGSVAAWVEASALVPTITVQAFDIENVALGAPLTIAGVFPLSQISIGSQSIGGVAIGEQFSMGWVEGADGNGFGALNIQRFGFPLDLAGEPAAPVALGRDGEVGVDLDAPFMLSPQARAPGVAGLHDGEAAISYVTTDGLNESLNLVIIDPAGVEVLSHLNLAMAGQFIGDPFISSAGEGDIVVGWMNDAGAVNVVVMRIAGGWQTIETASLDLVDLNGDPAVIAGQVSFAVVGEDGISLIVSWRDGSGNLLGQRFDYSPDGLGDRLGDAFLVTDVDGTSSGLAGMLDGRFTSVYETTGDIGGHIFDTRSSEEPVIGRDAGGARGFEVGTAFDDIIDGRDRADTIYGALGNDVLIGGVGDDELFGGGGDDDLIGGTGTDALAGDAGDDLLMGGYGRDYISGGAGIDTLSYRGELRAVEVDLEAGTVRSNQAVNAVILPDAATTINGPATIIDQIFNDRGLEDVLGEIVEVNHDLEIFDFVANHGIENIEGSMGNDTLLGDGNDNVLNGLQGDDIIDGRGGSDTVVLAGARSNFVATQIDADTVRLVDLTGGSTGAAGDLVSNVEFFSFGSGTIAFADLFTAPPPPPGNPPVISGPAVLSALNEDTGRVITLAELLQNVTDADGQNTLSVTGVAASIGTLTDNGNGTWSYVPPANDDTSVLFSYSVTDGTTVLPHTASMDLVPQNDASTGAVTFTSPLGNNVLVATNDIADIDGLVGPVTYQWQFSRNGGSSWTDVAGATSANFTPAGQQIGAQVRVLAVHTDAFGTTRTASSVVALVGEGRNDTLNGTVGVNILVGMAGADQLNGLGGDDFLFGGAGADALNGGTGADFMAGGTGNDSYLVDDLGDVVSEAANEGTDTVSTALSTYALGANVENLTLTAAGANNASGNGLANVITDGNGSSVLQGLAGNDTINAGGGNDRFMASGSDGNDSYAGGAGSDTLDLSGITTANVVNVGAQVSVAGTTFAANRASGSSIGTDTLNSIENVIGGSGADTMIASLVRNEFTGGGGADRFVFSSLQNAGNGAANRDLIRDFTLGDVIDLRGIDADQRNSAGGDQAFSFIGLSTGPIAGGQIGYHFEIIGGIEHTIIEGNIRVGNNNTQVDFQVALLGHVDLTAADFFL
jgi:Ca2+-binding RTX toxin-like protein